MLVTLEPVDEPTLDRLVAAAVHDADADEVTPPSAGEGWSDARIAWLRDFHRDRRAGLAGPAAEATWAVVVDGRVVGGARLQRDARQDTLNAGLWLVRSVRNQGVGHRVLERLLEAAAEAEARTIHATTRRTNHAALAVLRRAGFEVVSEQGDRPVAGADFALTMRVRRSCQRTS